VLRWYRSQQLAASAKSDKPQSGEKLQPTAQAVGLATAKRSQPEGATEALLGARPTVKGLSALRPQPLASRLQAGPNRANNIRPPETQQSFLPLQRVADTN
jgi:hypothetical protein